MKKLLSIEKSWIETFPAHWEMCRLKDYTSTNTGITFTKADLVDSGNAVLSYGQIHAKNNIVTEINHELIRFIPDSLIEDKSSSKVKLGDFIFADTSEDLSGCGNCIYINEPIDLYVGYHTILLRNKGLGCGKYFAYLFMSDLWRSQIRKKVKSVKLYSVTQGILNQSFVIVPPIAEQEAIATYLDKECGKIGKEIGLLERKVDCYRNLRHSLIIKTVTQKKPNYRAYRLKDIFELRNGYTPSKAVSEFWEGGTIPWFRMEDIRKNGRILSDSIQHITQEAIKTAGLFEANSFILSTTATIGEHALLIADSLANQQFTNLKIRKSLKEKVSVKWMFYKFFHIDEYCKRGCRITTFAAVDMVELTNMPIYLPPIEEQLNNVAYLDDKCNKIDVIINKIESKIELLKELKRSLINEVVTGQRAINISKS